MEQSRLRELEEQCIQECAPPCTSFCPAHVDIRALASAVARSDFSAGLEVYRKSVPFPEIIARICDQPCKEKCYRERLGGAIRIRDLERACVKYADKLGAKGRPLPQKKAQVAVIGGGLSGLSAAYELSRKGYPVTLFESENMLGGRLWSYPEEGLPRDVIERETGIVSQAGGAIRLGETAVLSPEFLEGWDAVFLGVGRAGAIPAEYLRDSDGLLRVDTLTFQTSNPKVFAGGSLLQPPSPILSVSDGRRAAISIDRFVQNVSLSASRANEGPYETRLYVNVAENPCVLSPQVDELKGFSAEQAQAEAARCLQCECMECVKACEYLRHYGGYPKKYVREIYNNLSIIMRVRPANKMVNSCTLCGLCGEICPTDLDMGEVNLETRRTMVKTRKMPPSAHDFALRDMAFSNSDKFSLVINPGGVGPCQDVFFPGCQLAASSPEYIPRIYRDLLTVDPGMGLMLGCCGAPATWSGEEELFQRAADQIRRDWERLGRPRLVLACSSCKQMLNRALPDADAIPLWDVILRNRLFLDGRETPAGEIIAQDFVVHDPCTSRHEPAWQDSARALLGGLGVLYHELSMSKNLTECCGYGGVAWLAHPELVHDIVQRRTGEDQAHFLTYCAMCRDQFAGEGKPTLHLLDLIYGENLADLAVRKGPDYSQRHENRMRVKQKVIKMMTGKDRRMTETYEQYPLEISPEVRKKMEERLILVEDVQRVIEHAVRSGDRFINRANGRELACFKPNIITYWVEYTFNGITYKVLDAYSHRMIYEGDSSL